GYFRVLSTSPPHGGADRNIEDEDAETWHPKSPPHGARIETLLWTCWAFLAGVAPSRGRGSKHDRSSGIPCCLKSPPHGGADRNKVVKVNDDILSGRPLTGARIETIFPAPGLVPPRVAPSRGRGSKHVRIAG